MECFALHERQEIKTGKEKKKRLVKEAIKLLPFRASAVLCFILRENRIGWQANVICRLQVAGHLLSMTCTMCRKKFQQARIDNLCWV